MSNILKEAIADAKKIRETAIENAKATLTESLAPKLQSMLEKKLQEIEENVDENQVQGIEEEFNLEEMLNELAEEDLNEVDDLEEAEDKPKSDAKPKSDDKPKSDAKPKSDSTPKPNGEGEAEKELKDLSVEDFKDLIRDIIQSELSVEQPGAGLGDEGSMDIGGGEDLGIDGLDDGSGLGDDLDNDVPGLDTEIGNETEEFNLDELLAELETIDETDTGVSEGKELEEAKKELEEAKKAIRKLTGTLNEINLLNAKLLYTNKIFKSKQLSESQKINVLAKFDRARNIKEAKLIYETMKPTTGVKLSNKRTIKENLGFASKPAGNAPIKKTIVDPMVARWQKLANIKKTK